MENEEEIVWCPGHEVLERSRLLALMRRLGYDGTDAAAFQEFNRRAIEDPEWFWPEVHHELGIEFSQPYTKAREDSAGKPHPKWFVDGRINAAHIALFRHAEGELSNKVAVVYEGDSGQRRTLTYAELATEVKRFAANLAARGVNRGDCVVLYMPVVPEAAIAFLAVGYLGAIAVPTFSGYAAEALATRLQDSGAVALITADGTTRRGKTVQLKAVADEAAALAPTVTTVVVVNHLGLEVPMQIDRDIYYHELERDPAPIEMADTESNAPYTIIYTSGTTGRPKGIVHSHGGFVTKTSVDCALGFDIGQDDVVGWITDLGWLTAPILITAPLTLGATMVMIEGTPTYPEPNRLWKMVERNGVTVQGIAPTAARALRSAGGEIPEMPTLKSFVSTGEAWDEATWWWLFKEVGRGTRPIINFTGGTEIAGGILIGYPFLPSPPAAFTGTLPGVDAAVYDENGQPTVDGIGELVVLNTFPGQTHSFWNDDDRYLATYWSRWEDVWVHGDLASVDSNGFWKLHGRSDDTLKLSGRRVGPAEIEAALLRDSRISDVAVIGVPDEVRGQRAVAFAVLRDEDVDLKDLQATATANAGKGFSPTVYAVKTLPRTKNGKIMRRIIRARSLGQDTGDLQALDPLTPIDDIPLLDQ